MDYRSYRRANHALSHLYHDMQCRLCPRAKSLVLWGWRYKFLCQSYKLIMDHSTGKIVDKISISHYTENPLTHHRLLYQIGLHSNTAVGPRSSVGSAFNSRARGPGFDIRSGHILSFLLPLIQEGQLSVTGESMCTKYW